MYVCLSVLHYVHTYVVVLVCTCLVCFVHIALQGSRSDEFLECVHFVGTYMQPPKTI